MKIALVLMPNWPNYCPHLGIAYLTSQLMKSNHYVSRFEFNLKFTNEVWRKKVRKLEDLPTKVDLISKKMKSIGMGDYIRYCTSSILDKKINAVCFTTYKTNKNLTLLTAQSIKLSNPRIKIVIGGPRTNNVEDCQDLLESGYVDYILRGEADQTLVQLFQYDLKRIEPDIPGLMYWNNDKIIEMSDWSPIIDLDGIEFPLFRSEDIQKSESPWINGKKFLPIQATRGCKYRCEFCDRVNLSKKFRQRSADSVLNEIKYQNKTHGITVFRFNDNLINVDHNFILEFCSKLIKSGLSIRWSALIRASTSLTVPLLKLMKQSGCKLLALGIESGSDSVLKAMNKEITVEMVRKNIKDIHECGIPLRAYILIGYPTETESDFDETINFVRNIKKYIAYMSVSPFLFKPNTPIYDKSPKLLEESIVIQRCKKFEEQFADDYDLEYKSIECFSYKKKY
ncbi:B12-binding domain-containing radical SAM protein [Candidatus Woesearchaeota archaeon]|nr:B12-binding domain-containing radical SAM protein [Candidatus Woesearchaeota archaeon]